MPGLDDPPQQHHETLVPDSAADGFHQQAIKDGVPAAMVKDELEHTSNRSEELEDLIKSAGDTPKPLIHPAMAGRYQAAIKQLIHDLQQHQDGQAREHVRRLIEKIVLSPAENEGGLQIDLHGDLAGILSIATNEKRPVKNVSNDNLYRPSVKLVAGLDLNLRPSRPYKELSPTSFFCTSETQKIQTKK